jgi:hypothetical protein
MERDAQQRGRDDAEPGGREPSCVAEAGGQAGTSAGLARS